MIEGSGPRSGRHCQLPFTPLILPEPAVSTLLVSAVGANLASNNPITIKAKKKKKCQKIQKKHALSTDDTSGLVVGEHFDGRIMVAGTTAILIYTFLHSDAMGNG